MTSFCRSPRCHIYQNSTWACLFWSPPFSVSFEPMASIFILFLFHCSRCGQETVFWSHRSLDKPQGGRSRTEESVRTTCNSCRRLPSWPWPWSPYREGPHVHVCALSASPVVMTLSAPSGLGGRPSTAPHWSRANFPFHLHSQTKHYTAGRRPEIQVP